MNKSPILYILKTLIIDSIIILLLMFLISSVVTFTEYLIETKQSNVKVSAKNFQTAVEEFYRIDPSILTFNKENIAILKMDTLRKGVKKNGEVIVLYFTLLTKEQDECSGYIVVKKELDNSLTLNVTHVCDMLDY